MTTTERATLAATPFDVLQRVPAMNRVMQIFRVGGATHERIGKMDEVVLEGDDIVCRGASHDARINAGAIASVVVDRSGRMKDMVLPRLDFRDANGETVFGVISMDGLESFDAALAGLAEGEALAAETREAPEKRELGENDPGLAPFTAAVARATPIVIEVSGPGFRQAWSGVAESVKPSMGFINVMRPDFHLHLKAGAVASWRTEGEGKDAVWIALGQDGAPTGLKVLGDIGAA